jgi:hypothetical protein
VADEQQNVADLYMGASARFMGTDPMVSNVITGFDW